MTSLRRFKAEDLFKFNNINLDPLTETYSISSYLQYLGRFYVEFLSNYSTLAQWPDYFYVAENNNNALMGYVMGKAEGDGGMTLSR